MCNEGGPNLGQGGHNCAAIAVPDSNVVLMYNCTQINNNQELLLSYRIKPHRPKYPVYYAEVLPMAGQPVEVVVGSDRTAYQTKDAAKIEFNGAALLKGVRDGEGQASTADAFASNPMLCSYQIYDAQDVEVPYELRPAMRRVHATDSNISFMAEGMSLANVHCINLHLWPAGEVMEQLAVSDVLM